MPESDVSRRELERQIMELKREKVRIEDNIRRMDNNQKRADEARARDAAREAAKEEEKKEEEEKPKKRKRSRSGSEESKASKKSKNGKDDDKSSDDEAKKEKKREDEKERRKRDDNRPKQTDKRSRAMFGGLLGHLKSAKTRLETEKGWEATKKRNEAMERLTTKIATESANQLEKRKAQWAQNREDEEAKRAEITQTIAEKEALLLQRRLENHYGLMMNYIRTKAEPTIFYLPARGTKKTDVLLDETRDAIKNKIKSLKGQLKPMPEEEASERANAAAAAAEAALGGDKKDAKSDDEASIPDGAPRTAAEADEKKDDEDKKEDDDKKGDDSD